MRPSPSSTAGVDPEIAQIAGPQLVVPVTNARYALNAANARWGSLYDALYGTDALGDRRPAGPTTPGGAPVSSPGRASSSTTSSRSRDGSHRRRGARTRVDGGRSPSTLADGDPTGLVDEPSCFVGYAGEVDAPSMVLLEHHRLGIELVVDRAQPVGRDDPAGVADVMLEAAVTAIVDCEDSVAAVDGADKAVAYRNWLGLMTGDLTEDGHKGRHARSPERWPPTAPTPLRTAPPSTRPRPSAPAGSQRRSPDDHAGRSRRGTGSAVPEGLLDAMVTVLCAMPDLRSADTPLRNSPAGSMYVVKPKMHGPDEVAFAVEVFDRVERDRSGCARTR